MLNLSGAPQKSATITAITQSGGQYIVAFQTSGFTPDIMHTHVHFFLDTVPPEQAGAPGSGPWFVYGGPSPCTGYGVADRPGGATKLCVLVANHGHSVIPGSGNCVEITHNRISAPGLAFDRPNLPYLTAEVEALDTGNEGSVAST